MYYCLTHWASRQAKMLDLKGFLDVLYEPYMIAMFCEITAVWRKTRRRWIILQGLQKVDCEK
jgi:hypothetical protein